VNQYHRRRQHRRAHKAARAAEATPILDHPRVAGTAPEWIAAQADLDALVDALRAAGTFAYDTEFIGEQSFEPKVCLIQVATEDRLALIDPLAEMDLAGFWALLFDEGIEKLVHAGEQDLEHAARRTGRPCRRIFDTQVAAGFTGCRYPMSLEKLLAEKTDARLAGGLTVTEWDRRPLSDVQVRYAADDVRYLPLLAEALRDPIEAAGHTAWCRAECEARAAAADPLNRPVREVSLGRGNARDRQVLSHLTAWRQEVARIEDRPPRALISDGTLRYLAQRQPPTEAALREVRDLPRGLAGRHGASLLEAIRAGQAAEPAPPDPAPALPDRSEHPEAVEALWEAVCRRCAARGVAVDLVASKRQVARHALARIGGVALGAESLGAGWRGELLEGVL